MFDTIIIGAGITGTAVAHFISKTALSVLVVEAKEDVAEGSTKANSAIVHAGYDAKPGTLKAKYNVCLLYTSPSPRDMRRSRMPSSA